jgi:predicted transposase YdaD
LNESELDVILKEGNQMKKYPSLETVLKGKEIIARNMLKMGMPIEEITQATELPVEKIHSLAAVH